MHADKPASKVIQYPWVKHVHPASLNLIRPRVLKLLWIGEQSRSFLWNVGPPHWASSHRLGVWQRQQNKLVNGKPYYTKGDLFLFYAGRPARWIVGATKGNATDRVVTYTDSSAVSANKIDSSSVWYSRLCGRAVRRRCA